MYVWLIEECYVYLLVYCVCFFFFKQKTAYEMRISYWSSDVCSSDLGDHRRLPQTHAAALGRLSLCATGDDPAPDPLVIAPLPATSWDQPPARGHGRQGAKAQVQDLPDRLLPHRHRRGADRRRQRSEEHTSELQSLMRSSYAVFC